MFCCVVDCPNKIKPPANKRCFPFPRTFYKSQKLLESSKRRREAWIRSLRIVAPVQEVISQLGVCSNHFLRGCPAKLSDVNNPDWVPNKFLGTGENRICEIALKRKLICTKNNEETLEISDSESFAGSGDEYDEPNLEFVSVEIPPEELYIFNENQTKIDKPNDTSHKGLEEEADNTNCVIRDAANPSTVPRENKKNAKQFAMTIQKLKMELQNKEQIIELYEEKMKGLENKCKMMMNSYELKLKEQEFKIKNLNSQLKSQDTTLESLRYDDLKVRTMTGLHDFSLLNKLYEVVADNLSEYQKSNVDKFQFFVITLMKLRMDLPMAYLTYLVTVPPLIISKLYRENIAAMHTKLGPLIKWPDDEVLMANTPDTFKEIMGKKSIIFIHFLEILIKNLKATKENLECMKHKIKYLIAFISSGEIIFVSHGFGSECSNESIIEESGFFDKINEETIVLCVKDMFDESQKDNNQIQRIKHMAKNTEDKVIDFLKENFRILFNRQCVNSVGEVYSKFTVECCCALANLLLLESSGMESTNDSNDREVEKTMAMVVNGDED